MSEQKKTTAIKSTQTSREAYPLLKKKYAQARDATIRGAPIAWEMAVSMAEEMLYAMDVVQIFTENYGGVAAATKGAGALIQACEADGYSSDICGYVRTGIGHAIRRKQLGMIPPDAPAGGMADPTMLIGSSGGCEPRYKWYQSLARYMDIPYFCTEVVCRLPPSTDPDEVEEYVIPLQVEELRRLKEFLEKTLGRKMNEDKLMEAVATSQETKNWYWKCDEIRRAVPCPMPVEDMLSCMPFGYFYAPDPDSTAFYKRLYAELEHRVTNKIGVIPDEKYRLLWGWGLPPWHNMNIFNYFEEKGAVFVMQVCYTAYTYFDGSKYSDPLERIAREYFHRANFMNKKANQRRFHTDVQYVMDWLDEYKCDGLVQHQLVSCRLRTVGQIAAADQLKGYAQVPVMFMESDLVDERTYSEAQEKAKVDAFMDTVESYKQIKRQM